MNLYQLLQERFHAVLKDLVADPSPYLAMIKPAQDAKHGDYQANCAMSLGKVLKKPPREVAEELVRRLDLGDLLEPPQVAGPGFINLRFRPQWLAAQIQTMARDERLGVPPAAAPHTLVIDFSSPNVAKPMHVGHLRSTIIGDALARLFRFLGHHVVTDNHLGDWGTQFGMLLYGYKHYRDEAALQADPVREMVRLYVLVRRLAKAADDDEDGGDNPIAEAARQETAKLHAGDPENVRLWQMFMPWSQAEIDGIYQRLDIRFDHTHGESFYNPMLPGVVRSLLEKGIAEESQGAVVVFFGEGQPPSLVRKKDGAFTYTTSDLATIQYRMDTFKPNSILYVVGFPQALHFKNLFTIARRWGYEKVDLEHVTFGSVLGSDGKTIKTRSAGDDSSGAPAGGGRLGGIVELSQLMDEAIVRAGRVCQQSREERLASGHDVPPMTPQQVEEVATVVGIGAVKYADLCQNRTSDYKFDWDKMLATNGNSSTYMQYAYARTRSILRKGEVDVPQLRAAPPLPLLVTPHERLLGLQLLRFEEALQAAAADYRPNLITAYLWDLANQVSGFYQNCPVLQAETDELRQGRLLLCDLVGRVIQQGLDLLGIRTLEQM
jgi:arginyl-tRNA synthetase